MTKYMFQRILPLLALCLLMIACSPVGNGGISSSTTPTTQSTHSSGSTTSTPSVSTTDTCPANLSKDDPGCLTPHALRVAYGIQSLIDKGFTGKGQTVIDIVSFGSPTLQQDVDAFDRQFNLPPITIQVIAPLNEKEYDPRGDKPGWAEETTLDVEAIHALAPGANIVVLVSPVAETEGTIGLPEFRQLTQYALDHHLGNIVSQSWGASEVTLQDQAGQQELQKWDTLYQQATTQQGVTYLTASGDGGATDYADLQGTKYSSSATTSFAADDPWVTSVGGTTLTLNATTRSESAWSGSGGGFSRFFKTPSYQQTLSPSVQSELNNRRGVPDVAATANPRTALAIYIEGQWAPIGGTSASTPMWAAIIAIADQVAGHPLGFINPGLYKLAQSSSYTEDFHDITSGNNTNHSVQGYSATQGWDPVTGLGSPNAEKLIPDLIAAIK